MPPQPDGSVVIPAHNEGRVLGRLLDALAEQAASGRLEVVVVPNGCSDDTTAVASRYPGVRVVELDRGSKSAALNAGDAAASAWPRLYVDADVELTGRAVRDTLAALRTSPSGRPVARYDTAFCTWPVRAYYRARDRMPELHTHLWGAGVYGVSEEGRRRFAAFPEDTADDVHVDDHFERAERAIVATDPVVVHPPRTVRALLHTLVRVRRGARQSTRPGSVGGWRVLARSVRSLPAARDAVVYATLTLLARVAPRRAPWERDPTTR